MQRFFSVPAFLTIFAMTSQTSSQKMDTWRELVFSSRLHEGLRARYSG